MPSEKSLNSLMIRFFKILEEKQQETQGDSQPSKSSEQQEDAEEHSDKSKAAD